MIIINQDRDNSVQLQKNDFLNIKINTYENKIIGYSLYINNINLGTFDTLKDVILEKYRILNCKYSYYIVNGFKDYLNCF